MRPGFKELNMQNLHMLDGGKLAAAFDHHLQTALMDCEDRPHDTGKRKVTLEIEIVPVPDDVSMGHVTTVYNVKTAVPKAKTRAITLPAKVVKDSHGREYVETTFAPSDDGEEPDFLKQQQERESA
jgi:hypothetical protein